LENPPEDRFAEVMGMLPRISRLSTSLSRGRLMEHALEASGLNLDRPAMGVLISLRMSDEPLRIGEIARRMEVAGPHVTRHLHVLEKRRLVRGLADPDDRRARLVELTPDGAEIADRYVTTLLGWFGDALSGWTPEDRRTFYDLLLRFTDDLAAFLAATAEAD